MRVHVREDDPEKGKVRVYKTYERKVRTDALGDYVLIRKQKHYIYENGHVRMILDK